jgi:hypothetical protein
VVFERRINKKTLSPGHSPSSTIADTSTLSHHGNSAVAARYMDFGPDHGPANKGTDKCAKVSFNFNGFHIDIHIHRSHFFLPLDHDRENASRSCIPVKVTRKLDLQKKQCHFFLHSVFFHSCYQHGSTFMSSLTLFQTYTLR